MTTDPRADDDPVTLSLVRLRHAVAENYTTVVVVLLLVAAAGGWVTFTTHLSPGTQTEERTVATWSRTADFSHSATVTRSNPVYETGQRLTEQRAYFPRVTETLGGDYTFRYAASDRGQVDISVTIYTLVQNRDSETVYWQDTKTMAETTSRAVAPGESVAVTYDLNLNRTQRRLERTEDVFGDSPGESEVLVQAETRLSGNINGRTVDRAFVDTLRLQPEGEAFTVDDPGELTNSTARTEPVQVPREYSPVRHVGGLTAMLVGLVGSAGLVVVRRREALAPSSAALDRVTRAEYTDWLSPCSLSVVIDPADDDVVVVPTLVDLVDIAADTNSRVLDDDGTEWYVVTTDSRTYACRPPLHR